MPRPATDPVAGRRDSPRLHHLPIEDQAVASPALMLRIHGSRSPSTAMPRASAAEQAGAAVPGTARPVGGTISASLRESPIPKSSRSTHTDSGSYGRSQVATLTGDLGIAWRRQSRAEL